MTRVTYIAAGRSAKTRGLVKVGISQDPHQRVRGIACELLGTTALSESVMRQILRPFLVSHSELRERNIASGAERGGEWYRDCFAVRLLIAWAVEFRPVEEEEEA
jgi:hypothetical protein